MVLKYLTETIRTAEISPMVVHTCWVTALLTLASMKLLSPKKDGDDRIEIFGRLKLLDCLLRRGVGRVTAEVRISA